MKGLPSDGELEILRVLWLDGPATVKQVHERLPRRSEVGYNTVGKLLQIMEGKGLVARDASERAHVFHPLVERLETQRGLVRDLAERAFGGSATALAVHALSAEDLSDDEVGELKALLAELER
jgi:predicted transcriptional regulator